MDELSRKFRAIDWKGLQKSARKVQASTASALKDMVMTDLENKTRAATADTAWGASGTDLMQIAQGTYRREDYALIMSIVWQRLASSRWRCVHKALELLRHLVMHGAARCAEEARMALPHLHALQQYHALDEAGRDVGEAVRRRSKLVCDMLSDSAILEEERAKSRELRSKLQGGSDGYGPGRLGGISSEDFRRSAHAADPYGSSDPGPGAAARVATASFKGYGDDDDEDADAYDAAPSGSFAARAAAAAAAAGDGGANGTDAPKSNAQPVVEDLLGDDDPPVPALPPAPAGDGVDVLADLDAPANGGGAATNGGAMANGGAAVPLSQLVSSLAAQQAAGNMQLAVANPQTQTQSAPGAGTTGSPQSAAPPDVGDLFAAPPASPPAPGAPTSPPPPADGPKRVLNRVSEKEKDPFADLLSTGKQKGVL